MSVRVSVHNSPLASKTLYSGLRVYLKVIWHFPSSASFSCHFGKMKVLTKNGMQQLHIHVYKYHDLMEWSHEHYILNQLTSHTRGLHLPLFPLSLCYIFPNILLTHFFSFGASCIECATPIGVCVPVHRYWVQCVEAMFSPPYRLLNHANMEIAGLDNLLEEISNGYSKSGYVVDTCIK